MAVKILVVAWQILLVTGHPGLLFPEPLGQGSSLRAGKWMLGLAPLLIRLQQARVP